MSDSPLQQLGKRIHVKGTSGSGKSTFAKALAKSLNYKYIELDSLHWKPNWASSTPEEFHQKLNIATQGECWVLDGNYGKHVIPFADRIDTVIWLDYSFARVLYQVTKRTLRRGIKKEVLWDGCTEKLSNAFFSKDSIILWAITTFHRRRKEADQFFSENSQSLFAHRFKSPNHAESLLKAIQQTSKDVQSEQ